MLGWCLRRCAISRRRPETGDVWLLTDAGYNIMLSMNNYKWYYHLISASRAGAPYARDYKVAGPLCDSGDVYFDIEREGRLPDYRKLPEDVGPGEVLALLNCGAYSLAQMFHYNGRPLAGSSSGSERRFNRTHSPARHLRRLDHQRSMRLLATRLYRRIALARISICRLEHTQLDPRTGIDRSNLGQRRQHHRHRRFSQSPCDDMQCGHAGQSTDRVGTRWSAGDGRCAHIRGIARDEASCCR